MAQTSICRGISKKDSGLSAIAESPGHSTRTKSFWNGGKYDRIVHPSIHLFHQRVFPLRNRERL